MGAEVSKRPGDADDSICWQATAGWLTRTDWVYMVPTCALRDGAGRVRQDLLRRNKGERYA